MPTYEYRCKECDHQFDVVQAFTDDALTECPSCGGPLRKVFGNVGIAFKGSGFYKNDSRSGSSKTSTSASSSTGSEASGSSGESGTTSDSSSKDGGSGSGSASTSSGSAGDSSSSGPGSSGGSSTGDKAKAAT